MAFEKFNYDLQQQCGVQASQGYIGDAHACVQVSNFPIVIHVDEILKQSRELSAYAHNLVESLQGIGSLSGKAVPERSGLDGQLSEVQIAVQNAYASLRELRIYLIGGE